ncbi:hypothetical protein [Thalassobaculum sp.]|uniref:hypothetical protein n=1 Tax=Thalassobaculum sp. TaxID=2022740 RepID=UPI0032EE8E76
MALAYEIDAGPVDPGAADRKIRDRIEELVDKLSIQANEQVADRQLIEDRMIEDTRQHSGRYDPLTESELAKGNKSRVFINETRATTHAWQRRLSDLLFPTDDDNWGIKPTPVPELMDEGERVNGELRKKLAIANNLSRRGDAEGAERIAQQAEPLANRAGELRSTIEEAQRRAAAMQEVLRDQLRECGYNIASRQALKSMCKLGTAVLKGPVLTGRLQRRWGRHGSDGGWSMQQVDDPRPSFTNVDIWNFFPDMSAVRPDQRSFDYERHLFTPKELRETAKKPGFLRESIAELLTEGKPDVIPTYISQLREITGTNHRALDTRWHVWEFHGEIEPEDMLSLVLSLADEDRKATMLEYLEADPLESYRAVVWFSQGRVLKFGPHLLDSSDSIYSIANFEQDDGSLFGFGVPYLMRDSQAAMNGAWRAMMDNASISSNPPVIIDDAQVYPVDGKWTIHARKVFRRRADAPPATRPAIEVVQIPSNQPALAAIIQLAREFGDAETSMPPVAQGEGGAQATKTAEGLSLLMNSANVVFRGAVRNWDDDMTVPNIERLYHWNMQFNKREDIKGDVEVDARGSAVLLVRDIQAQNIMRFLTMAAGHPQLAPFVKNIQAARKLAQAMMLSADDILMTDDEIRQEMERQAAEVAKNPPPPDPDTVKYETMAQIAKMEADSRERVAQLAHQTAMMTLAEKLNMTIEELRSKAWLKQSEIESKERITAVEAAVAERTGQHAGGNI